MAGHSQFLKLGLRGFSMAVLEGDIEAAWANFCDGLNQGKDVLKKVDRGHCTKFLAMLPSGASTASKMWPRARQFKKAMHDAGYTLTSTDYATLINCCFKAGDYRGVLELWVEMDSYGVERDVVVWNQYIQATCDAFPAFWPKGARIANWERVGISALPPLVNNVQELLVKMELDGVVPNARTYELVLLAFARQGRLDMCDKIIEMAWLGPSAPSSSESLLWPSISTLRAIVDAYSFNKHVVRACELLDEMVKRYRIPIASQNAKSMWTALLRWVVIRTQPRGELPSEYFEQLWRAMVSKYRVDPTLGMWSIRVEFLEWKNQFDDMEKCIDLVMGLPYEEHRDAVAKSTLRRVIKGLTNTSRPLDAVAVMEKWAPRGLDVRLELQDYVRAKGATKEQLDMYKEDDDDDSFLGLS